MKNLKNLFKFEKQVIFVPASGRTIEAGDRILTITAEDVTIKHKKQRVSRLNQWRDRMIIKTIKWLFVAVPVDGIFEDIAIVEAHI